MHKIPNLIRENELAFINEVNKRKISPVTHCANWTRSGEGNEIPGCLFTNQMKLTDIRNALVYLRDMANNFGFFFGCKDIFFLDKEDVIIWFGLCPYIGRYKGRGV